MKKLMVMVALTSSMAAMATTTNVVLTTRMGEVTIVCPNENGWTFNAKPSIEGGADVVTIRLSSPTEATPPRFRVNFAADCPGVEHVWLSNFTKDSYGLWPCAWESSRRNSSQLAYETPIAVAFDYDETACLAAACSEVFEKVDFTIEVRENLAKLEGFFEFFTQYATPRTEYVTKIRLDRRANFWADAVRESSEWVSDKAGFVAAEVPEAAYDPLYSTWYAWWQDVHAKPLEREAKLAAELGMKTMILDDGWQKKESATFYSATGDWMPVASRFPDMKAHVDAVHKAGLKYMIWVSVPYVGDESQAWRRFKDKMLSVYGNKTPGRIGTLDPRFPEVREYLISTYERIVGRWGFDGIKLDFIDHFKLPDSDPAVKDNYAGRDYKSVPEAVDVLMKEILKRLKAINPEVLIEFRQHYMGPAILQYGNMMRAADCPADPWSNRKRICDLRLTSGKTAVHSDMIVWNREETVEGAAIPILNALFSTIQYSMILKDAKNSHREVIRHWLAFSQKHRATLLKGEFRPRHPDANYPLIEAESDDEAISAVYNRSTIAAVKSEKPTYIINATKATSLVIDSTVATKWTSYDTLGNQQGTGAIAVGLARIAVPASGYLRFGH